MMQWHGLMCWLICGWRLKHAEGISLRLGEFLFGYACPFPKAILWGGFASELQNILRNFAGKIRRWGMMI